MLVFWNGKSFYLSKLLAENLDSFIAGVMNKNTSAVFLFDGKSGLGKSTLSCQVGCYINNRVKEWYAKKGRPNDAPDFNLDCLKWTPETFIERLKNTKPGDIIIFDEAMIVSSRSSMTAVNRAIVIMMSMIRSRQLFVIFNVNSVFDLDKNLPLHRADMLISLYPKEGKFAARGAYLVVPSFKLTRAYIMGKKFYDYRAIHKAKAFNDTFSAFFPFDEIEYERRKQEAIVNYQVSGQKREIASDAQNQRDTMIRYLVKNSPDLSKDDIARIANVSIRTVYRALKQEQAQIEAISQSEPYPNTP